MSASDVVPSRPVDHPPVDAGVFRKAMGRFATGVTVVATTVGDNDYALTANAFSSVSLEPMLVLVCIEQEARFHDAIEVAGFWSVSVLDDSARAAAAWLSTRGRPLHGQLDRVPHHRGPRTGAPLLDQSLATMECRTTALHEGGDHTIVVGEVIGADLDEHGAAALTYFRGRYGRLA